MDRHPLKEDYMTTFKSITSSHSLTRMVSVLTLALLLGTGVTSTAMADPHDQQGRDRGEHHDEGSRYGRDRHENEWREHEKSAYYGRAHRPVYHPDYVYAPPVIYAPPPPTGLNLIIPLRIN